MFLIKKLFTFLKAHCFIERIFISVHNCIAITLYTKNSLYFQPSLRFVGKARNVPYSGAPERCFIRVVSGFTRKHQTELERLARDKHSSLLQTFVNYGCEKFYKIGGGWSISAFNVFIKSKFFDG